MKSKIQKLMTLVVLVAAGAATSAFSPKHALANTFQASRISGVYHYYVVGTVPPPLICTVIGESCTISTNLTLIRLNNSSPPSGHPNYTSTFPPPAIATRLSPGSIFQ